MGAGFASGRETWQFFGVFGGYGRAGILIFAAIFMAVGFMVSYNASRLGTHDMGSVIVPGNSKRLKDLTGYFMAITLAVVMVAMSAAAGALMHQYFGTQKQGMVRFSFSYYNTEKEALTAAEAIREIAEEVEA